MSSLAKVYMLEITSMAICEIKSLSLIDDTGFGDNSRRVVNFRTVMVVLVIPNLVVVVENINKLLGDTLRQKSGVKFPCYLC